MGAVHIHLHRTADGRLPVLKAAGTAPDAPRATAAGLWADLQMRMAGALAELKGRIALGTTKDEWREDLHPRASNGQFGHGEVHADGEQPQKPTQATAKGGMDKIRELLMSGHPFTKEELLAATGLNEKRVGDYLAMLKNPKWAGKQGALKIERDDKGNYFVAKADGTPAPMPPVVVPTPPVPEAPKGGMAEQVARTILTRIGGHEYTGIKNNEHLNAAKDNAEAAVAFAEFARQPGLNSMAKEHASAQATMFAGNAKENYQRFTDSQAKATPPAPPPGVHPREARREKLKANMIAAAGQAAMLQGGAQSGDIVHSAGVRAMQHLDTAGRQLDESRKTEATDNYRDAALDSAEQSIKAAVREIEYGTERQAPPTPASPGLAAAKAKVLAGSAPKYVPLGNSKKTTQWAEQNGYLDKADFDKLDPAVSDAFMSSLSEHLQEFPQLRNLMHYGGSIQGYYADWKTKAIEKRVPSLRRFYPDRSDKELREMAEKQVKSPRVSSNTWACAWKGNGDTQPGGVGVHATHGGKGKVDKWNDSLKSNVTTKWHPEGCDTIKSVMDHELGHKLDYLLDLRNNPEMRALNAKGWTEGATGQAGNATGGATNVKQNMTRNVSAYAATNSAEFIAEAWGEYRNNPNPRPLAKQVGELIKRAYAAKYPNP